MKTSDQTKGKPIYRSTGAPGIRSVWDWSHKKQNYVCRTTGSRYLATVEKNGRTKSQSFCSIEEARRWREKIKYELERLPDVKPMTFNQLVNSFLEKKKEKVQITTLESGVVAHEN